jgi:signal transduction histidine kinase
LFVADVVAQIVVSAGGHAPSRPLSVVGVLLAAAAAGLFWWRRSHPLLVVVGSVVAIVVAGGKAPPGLLTLHTGVPLVLAVYAAGAWSERRAQATVLSCLVMLAVFAAASSHAAVPAAGAVALAIAALPFVAGVAARARRHYVEEVERRLQEAERDRDERARRAALDERRHIARELHDLVAHHVSLIGVQAGAARSALEHSGATPDTTRTALLAIEASSRSAVGEMRQLLDVLRGEDGDAHLQPQPGLAQLQPLVDGFRSSGLDVAVSVAGEVSDLDPMLDLCCYRVIEEALTNVTRHSTGRTACVHVTVLPDSVDLVVDDAGRARGGTSGTGRGLLGLQERVALCAGVLTAGPTAEGFEVRARIPRRAGG